MKARLSDIRNRIEARRLNRSKYYPDLYLFLHRKVSKIIEFELNDCN